MLKKIAIPLVVLVLFFSVGLLNTWLDKTTDKTALKSTKIDDRVVGLTKLGKLVEDATEETFKKFRKGEVSLAEATLQYNKLDQHFARFVLLKNEKLDNKMSSSFLSGRIQHYSKLLKKYDDELKLAENLRKELDIGRR
ncbi:MAG: hypothetical protein OIF32_02380 [Campylobacterales bacterium]|nr:hypothetical protein [Campylobacterales bacterium]